MPKTLYSTRLSDAVVHLLFLEGQRRRMPMTRLADELILRVLSGAVVAEPDWRRSDPNGVIIRKRMTPHPRLHLFHLPEAWPAWSGLFQ